MNFRFFGYSSGLPIIHEAKPADREISLAHRLATRWPISAAGLDGSSRMAAYFAMQAPDAMTASLVMAMAGLEKSGLIAALATPVPINALDRSAVKAAFFTLKPVRLTRIAGAHV